MGRWQREVEDWKGGRQRVFQYVNTSIFPLDHTVPLHVSPECPGSGWQACLAFRKWALAVLVGIVNGEHSGAIYLWVNSYLIWIQTVFLSFKSLLYSVFHCCRQRERQRFLNKCVLSVFSQTYWDAVWCLGLKHCWWVVRSRKVSNFRQLVSVLWCAGASNVVGGELDSDGVVKKKDAVQVTDNIGQSFTPSPWHAGQ